MRNSLKRDLKNTAPKLTLEDIKAYFQVLKPFIHADGITKQLHIESIQEKLGQFKS